uniref:RHD domain-containing protein n=1 Tax=Oryctolagus cuniculus TaxID=9986 RepID=A0A5F9DJR3_RABIT
RAVLCSTWLSGRAFPEQLLEGESLGKGNSPLGTPRGGPLLFLHPGLPRGGRFRVLLRLRRVPSALEAWALLAPVAATRPLRAHACPLSCLPTALGETPSLAAPPPWPPPALSPLPGDPAPHPHRGLSQGPSPLPARPLSSTLPFLFLQAPCPSAGSWELSPGPDPEPAVAWKPAQSPRRTWRPGLCHGRWPAALRSRLFGGSVGPRCAPSPGASTRHCGLRQAAPQRSWGTGFLSRAFVAVDRGTGGSGAPRANHLALPSLRASRLFLQVKRESFGRFGSLKNHQEVDMNVVKICFQASYQNQQGQMRHMDPVLSEPIYNKSEWRPLSRGPCAGTDTQAVASS